MCVCMLCMLINMCIPVCVVYVVLIYTLLVTYYYYFINYCSYLSLLLPIVMYLFLPIISVSRNSKSCTPGPFFATKATPF